MGQCLFQRNIERGLKLSQPICPPSQGHSIGGLCVPGGPWPQAQFLRVYNPGAPPFMQPQHGTAWYTALPTKGRIGQLGSPLHGWTGSSAWLRQGWGFFSSKSWAGAPHLDCTHPPRAQATNATPLQIAQCYLHCLAAALQGFRRRAFLSLIWRCQGLNLRPAACNAGALMLSI